MHGRFAAWRDNGYYDGASKNLVHIVETTGWITRLCDGESLMQLEKSRTFALTYTTATCLSCIQEWLESS